MLYYSDTLNKKITEFTVSHARARSIKRRLLLIIKVSIFVSLTNRMSKMCTDFMHLQFSKSEPCYYVKYRIFDGALKVEKEEYYYTRVFDEGKQKELIHRPTNWKAYLIEQNCSNILDQCFEEQLKFLREQVYGN